MLTRWMQWELIFASARTLWIASLVAFPVLPSPSYILSKDRKMFDSAALCRYYGEKSRPSLVWKNNIIDGSLNTTLRSTDQNTVTYRTSSIHIGVAASALTTSSQDLRRRSPLLLALSFLAARTTPSETATSARRDCHPRNVVYDSSSPASDIRDYSTGSEKQT